MRMRALTLATVALTGLIGAIQIQVSAQGARRPAAAAATPAPGGDVKTVLHDWANHMGMLRGVEERDLIATLEYLGTGSASINGQPCKVTRYRATINYQMRGMRAEIGCTRADGQNHEEIQVVGGEYAWNEVGGPGAGLVPGKGTAVPAREAYNERAIRLWSGPQGAVKAAVMGGANTKVGVENGKTTVTFPIPGRRRRDRQGDTHLGTGRRPVHEELCRARRGAAGQRRHRIHVLELRGLQRSRGAARRLFPRAHHRETGRTDTARCHGDPDEHA